MARRGEVRSPEAAALDKDYWEGGDHQTVEVRKMGPERMKSAAKAGPRPHQPPVRTVTAQQALDAMRDTKDPEIGGTNPEKLQPAQQWIESLPTMPTGVELFHHLEVSADRGEPPIARGTLEKLGRWLWGKQFRLADATVTSPAEDLRRAHEELSRLRETIREKTGEVLSMQHQVGYLSAQLKDRNAQLDFLKAGKTPAELAQLEKLNLAAAATATVGTAGTAEPVAPAAA